MRRADLEAVRNYLARPPTNPHLPHTFQVAFSLRYLFTEQGKRMTFSHPLTRSAGVFAARSSDGDGYRVLAIVTTLELDPKSRRVLD